MDNKIIDGLKYVQDVLCKIPVTDIAHCDMKVRAYTNIEAIIQLINDKENKESEDKNNDNNSN